MMPKIEGKNKIFCKKTEKYVERIKQNKATIFKY